MSDGQLARVFLFLCFVMLCECCTVYVSPLSNVTDQCGTIQNPCGTIQSGISSACSTACPGGNITVSVAAGNYTQSFIQIDCPLSLM